MTAATTNYSLRFLLAGLLQGFAGVGGGWRTIFELLSGRNLMFWNLSMSFQLNRLPHS